MDRIRHADDHFTSWQPVDMPSELSNCERCAPTAPQIAWIKLKNKMVAVENSIQAGAYERSLKRRPTPFVTQLKLDNDGLGSVRVGLNIPSLLHRAMSRLPSQNRHEPVTLSWRLDTNFTPAAKLTFPKFNLLSNKFDTEHAQPPNFKVELRVEQLRSLTWMLAREAADAAPFIEEEVSEAMLDPLGWRAEGRAQRPIHVRGGVLADQVGYGKTAITLALIDCTAKRVQKELEKKPALPGKIRTKATLCIVPPHLTRQWNSELKKFIGTRYKSIVLSTAANLNSHTIEEFQEADLIIVASNLYRSNVYLENFETLAAAGSIPAQDGRYFDSRVDEALKGLARQTDRLRDEGSIAVMKEIREARKRGSFCYHLILDQTTYISIENEPPANVVVPTKRLKGKSYREAADDKKAIKVEETVDLTSDTEEPVKKKYPGPSGLKMEVVIPVYGKSVSSSAPSSSRATTPATTPAPSSSGAESNMSDEESDAPRARKRRATARKSIIISDDEDIPPVKSRKAAPPKKGRKTGKASSGSSSDYEDGEDDYEDESESAEETASESESVQASDSDEEPKSKSKAKKKAPAKKPAPKRGKKQSLPSSEASEEDMDVDDPPPKANAKANGKKRKAEGDAKEKPAKKQKKREETDPWKLESAGVKRDWTQMQAPPLEMFHFSRIVVDEYTYLDGRTHSMVTRQSGDRKWVLSGTVSYFMPRLSLEYMLTISKLATHT